MKKGILIFLFILSFSTQIFGIVFYSNPEDISKYVNSGLYPENKFTKKVPLNTNWQFRLEGDDEWNDIYIPSAYDSYDPSKKIYFRTSFSIGGKKSSDRSYKLVFYGINYKCNVKVNDVFLENHSSANSFEINLDKNQLNFEETNTLTVEVTSKLSSNTVPSEMQVDGWRNYGGIFRDVYLIINSQVLVSDAEIDYYFNSDYSKVNAEILAEIKDNNIIKIQEEDSVSYENNIYSYFEITDLSAGKIVHASEKKNHIIRRFGNDAVKFNFEINEPKLWSPENPNMYLCSVYLGNIGENGKENDFDRYDISFGFKDLKLTGNKFFLNGERFFLKGVSRYEDIKDMGNAITYSRMRSEIEKIKNLGSNILYCNAYAPHPYILDLCDRYGIFVLQEIPVNSVPSASLANSDFTGQSFEILEETLTRDKNHVSFFGIGLGFGYNVYDLQAVDFIKDLSDKAKEINDEIFTFITSEFTEYEEYYKLTDFNVITLYSHLPESELKFSAGRIGKKAESKPVIINNRLPRVYPGNQNGYSDPYSEPAQAKRLLESYNIVLQEESISGIIIDSFRDRRSDVSLLTNKPGDDLHIIRNGIIDYEGNERLSFRVLDALFKSRKGPALAQGEYSKPEVNIYFILGVIFTLLFLYMVKREHYLFINSVRSIKNPDAFFIDIRDRRITQLLQAFFVGSLSAYGIAAVFSTIFYSFREDEKFDFLLTYFIRNDTLKKFLVVSSWEPLIFLVSATLLIISSLIVLAIIVKFFSIFFNMRYSMPIAISMTLWNAIVFLPLVPVSAVFIRIFNPFWVKLVILTFCLMLIWFIIRLFLIMAVSFKTTVRKVLWVNFLVVFCGVLLWAYFFDLNIDRFSSFFYLVDLIVK